jgi:hypothetical protein
LLEHLSEVRVIQGVEVALDVRVDDPATHHVPQASAEGVQRLVRRASGAEAVRVRMEVRLVDRREHHVHGLLEDLVGERRDAQRALAPIRLRDVRPSDRWGAVLVALERVQQRTEVPVEVDGEVLGGLPVDAHRPTLSGAPVRLAQEVEVDVVRQRRQRRARSVPGASRERQTSLAASLANLAAEGLIDRLDTGPYDVAAEQ